MLIIIPVYYLREEEQSQESCSQQNPELLGPLVVNENLTVLDLPEKYLRNIKHGGKYSPKSCVADQKTAFIIPYR